MNAKSLRGVDAESPHVSVVIPTYNRPDLVVRAVRSVLSQTLEDLEVLVVVDGDYHPTAEALAAVDDDRVRLVGTAGATGGSSARNSGIAESRGRWIALLDDDDEWVPHKLERQLQVAHGSCARYPVVYSRSTKVTPKGRYIWPRRPIGADEHVSEYLFTRRSLFQGEGYIQTSSILAPRELFDRVRFTPGLKKHQDWDWTLRALRIGGAALEFVEESLVIVYGEENRPSVSGQDDWLFSRSWILERRELVTERALASFLLTVVSSAAAHTRSPRVFLHLLMEAFRQGRPAAMDVAIHCGLWLIPRNARRTLRSWMGGARSVPV